MTNTHTPVPCAFNPDWIYQGRFADGDFQGCLVEISAINNMRDCILFAARNKPSYWTATRLERMESEYAAAIAKAKGEV